MKKNKWVAGTLYTVATAQFVLGVYISVHAAMNPPGEYIRPITQTSEFRD